MSRLLALDCSTKSTGAAVFIDKKLVYYTCISSSSTDKFKRIDKMAEGILAIIEEYKIDRIIMEDVLPNDVKNNAKVYKALMYLQGFIVKRVHETYGIEIEFVFPSEWRAKCNIKNGRGVKRDTEKAYDIAFVKETYGVDANDDVCDAICIGHAALPTEIVVIDGFQFG